MKEFEKMGIAMYELKLKDIITKIHEMEEMHKELRLNLFNEKMKVALYNSVVS